MANKIKKISIDAFENAVNSTYEPTVVVNWNGLGVVVKRHLTLSEVARFVDICTRACYNAEDNSYAPEAKDFAVRSCIVSFYTNISLPSNLEKQYDLIYHSSIIEYIIGCIDEQQLNAITLAIDEKIDYLVDVNADFVKRQMSELVNTFENLHSKMDEFFGGISQEDMKGVVDALSGGTFDEEKLVKAYLANSK